MIFSSTFFFVKRARALWALRTRTPYAGPSGPSSWAPRARGARKYHFRKNEHHDYLMISEQCLAMKVSYTSIEYAHIDEKKLYQDE